MRVTHIIGRLIDIEVEWQLGAGSILLSLIPADADCLEDYSSRGDRWAA